MKAKVAVIGGTSLLASSIFSHLEATAISTPYGTSLVYTNAERDSDIIFIQRHHADGDAGVSVYHPPHLINHRANLHALSQFSPSVVLAVCSVGSLKPTTLPPGSLCLPDDYFAIFCPTFCVHEDARAHIVPAIDSSTRAVLTTALEKEQDPPIPGLTTQSGVTYVQTTGPRFETSAESAFLSNCGDIVGMTAANEATAAKELGLKYAVLSMVDNCANGLADNVLTPEEFKESVAKHQVVVERATKICIEKLVSL